MRVAFVPGSLHAFAVKAVSKVLDVEATGD